MHKIVKFVFDQIEEQNTNILGISASVSITATAIYDWRRCRRIPRVDYLDEVLGALGYELTVKKIGE